jgi:deoxyribodipyrimidine photolyase
MHNRMRMIVAMFLSKDLMLDWHLGEQARLFFPFSTTVHN